MISAVGRKNSVAASTQRLMDDVPLWAAAAIQRGPSTAAMLNSMTSQKPISRRSRDLAESVSDIGTPRGNVLRQDNKREPQARAKSKPQMQRKRRKRRCFWGCND